MYKRQPLVCVTYHDINVEWGRVRYLLLSRLKRIEAGSKTKQPWKAFKGPPEVGDRARDVEVGDRAWDVGRKYTTTEAESGIGWVGE